MNTRSRIALTLAAAGSVALAGAALAHPHEGGESREKVQKVMVLSGKHGGKDAHERVQPFRMMRGPDGEFRCPNGEAARIDETTDGARTRILMCGDDKVSNADHARKLEETLARIRAEDRPGAEHKAKVEAALQEAIARLRAGN